MTQTGRTHHTRVLIVLAFTLALGGLLVAFSQPAEAENGGKPRPDENGRIAFSSDRDGDAEIFTAEPDGSDLRQLTFNEADDYGPDYSPPGSGSLQQAGDTGGSGGGGP